MNIKVKIFPLLLFSILTLSTFAQISNTGKKDAFPKDDRRCQKFSFYGGLGATWMFPFIGENHSEEIVLNDFEPNVEGRLGAFLELGAYHMFFNQNLIRYIDYGLTVKSFGASEVAKGDFFLNNQEISDPKYQFYQWWAGLQVNANNIINLGRKTFIQNTLGLNFDFRFYHNTEGNTDFYPNASHVYDNNLLGQVHYKLGLGIRPNERFTIVPAIEIPIVGLYQWDNANPSFNYFNTRQQPIILSVRIMWFRKTNGLKCKPPPPAPFEIGL